jgi:hypothetical protein
MAGLGEAGEGGVGRGVSAVAVEDVAEDVGGDVVALGGNVGVDVEVEVAAGGEEGVRGDDAVEEVGEPEEVGFVFDLERGLLLVRFRGTGWKDGGCLVGRERKDTYHPVEVDAS